MEASGSCKGCKKNSLIRDDVTGSLVCSSCGLIQPFDNYDPQLGGLKGPQGTFVRVGTAGTGSSLNYRDKKIFEAQKLIDDLLFKLGFSSEKSNEVRTMVSTITEGEFGQGDWFPVLVGACSYVVRRRSNRALPIAEVGAVIGCDVYELGRMIGRVVEFLNLKLPELDIVNSLELAFRKCGSLNRVSKDKVDQMLKQGKFLVQWAVKWFLTTGRRPLPMIAAVLMFVAELNQVDVRIENIANEIHAGVATSRLRYKELSEALVKVAQSLPWGSDVSSKNIVKNAPFVIQYMEMKLTEENLERIGFDLDSVVSECLKKEFDYVSEGYSIENGATADDRNGLLLDIDDSDKLKLSQESLSLMYSKFVNEGSRVNPMGDDGGDNRRRKRRREYDPPVIKNWWNGKSDKSKKLLLKQILEKDVGLNALPPSFVSGCLAYERRREKINAAKLRIKKEQEHLHAEKKRRRAKVDIDWEDFAIETLLLHHVKEDEIEKGHYNTLLDLHVFNSGNL
ncbi:hypothetical protein PVL29_020361 [Vitis rotundifolia]|uniref:BRF2-like C-terminal domain-containing protein n=1 Tax=Vitis rotundifolia TaxID=103349 RepID=A0AA38Z3W5_VITRO|nr:hypothetical protein PVL29_020361 [Vitis rotundifolia]